MTRSGDPSNSVEREPCTPGAESRHPRHELDETIHSPIRLSIMAALAASAQVEFRLLRDTVEVSDSVLSKNITALERAGYIAVTKGHAGKRPRTWLEATETGLRAYTGHWRALVALVEGDTSSSRSS